MDFEFGSWMQSLLSTVPVFILWSVLEFLRDRYWPYLFGFLPSAYNIQSLFTLSISFVVVFFLFTILNMKRTPLSLSAYLFFPKTTPREFRNLQTRPSHATIVNFKTVPPTAFYLAPDSYAWKLIKKHGESMWISESDPAPDDPNFLRKWCKERNYVLSPRIPDRTELLVEGPYSRSGPLDPRLNHVEYRAWLPFYCHFLHAKRIPTRRIIFNKSTNKAWPLDWWNWQLAFDGKIRGQTWIALPMPHWAQRWAKKHGFQSSDTFADMNDLLMKARDRKLRTSSFSS